MDTKPADEKSIKMFQMLNQLYDKTETLEEFAMRIIPTNKLKLNEEEVNYVSFLRATLVSFPRNARTMPISWNVEQQSQQHEIILRVVERIRRREGPNSSNLMTMGYYTKSDKSPAQVSASSFNVEYGFSNNNTSRLLYTHWKTLLSHIGDDAMVYLLENLVVFMFASSSCYIQLTGTPLYEQWPFRRYCAKSYQRSLATKRLCNSMLNDSKKKKTFRRRKSKVSVSRAVSDKTSSMNACTRTPRTLSPQKRLAKRKQGEVCETESERKRQCSSIEVCNEQFSSAGCKQEAGDICISSQENEPTTIAFEDIKVEHDIKLEAVLDCESSFDSKAQVALAANCNHVTLLPSNMDQGSPSLGSSCYLSACESFNGSLCISVSSGTPCVNATQSFCSPPHTGTKKSNDGGTTVTVNPSHQNAKSSYRLLSTNSACSSLGQTIKTETVHRRVRKSKLSAGQKAIAGQKVVPFDASLCLNRARLFYCKNLAETFLPRYLISGLVASDAEKLTERVLGTIVDGSSWQSEKTAGLRLQSVTRNLSLETQFHLIRPKLVEMMLCFTKNHLSCPYKHLLDVHCKSENSGSFPKSLKTKNKRRAKNSADDRKTNTNVVAACLVKKAAAKQRSDSVAVNFLLEQHCSHRRVYLFVRACCLRVIPTKLFGSQSNRNVFFRNIRKLIGMGRFEQLSLGILMSNMKVTHCRWMSELHSNGSRLRLLAKVLYWMMGSFVLILLRSFFYVTDTAVYKNRIFYYRKSVWKQIHHKGLAATLAKGVYESLTSEEAEKSVLQQESLGFASLRFLPKLKGLRSIVNMSQRRKLYEPTINSKLRNLHQIFVSKRAQSKVTTPGKHTQYGVMTTGSSVFSLDDIFARWKQFLDSRKRRNDNRPLYFVKVDIENCYDSIDQRRLFEIARRLLLRNSANDYVVRRYATVVVAGGRLKRSFHRVAASMADFQPSFLQFVKSKIAERQSSDMIFVDQVLNERFKSETLLKTLRLHLFNNVVKVDRKYFRQICGITQGSVLSTLLCDIYYDDMEKNKITVNEEDELLMRQVDDFLFVTPMYSSAINFLNLMLYGVADYGCRINVRKTMVNFAMDSSCPGEDPIVQLSENALFPWCGLLINTGSLSIHTDFTRYTGLHISDTITVDVTRSAGRGMLHKLVFSLRGRCHRIYLDTDINSDAAIAANVYRIFLLAAYKFHCYARRLPVRGNQAFLVTTLYKICSFVSSNVRKAVVAHGQCERDALDWNVVQLLCFEAFKVKLSRHQGGYGDVLKLISKRLRKLKRLLNVKQREQVDAALDNKLPAEFELMLT